MGSITDELLGNAPTADVAATDIPDDSITAELLGTSSPPAPLDANVKTGKTVGLYDQFVKGFRSDDQEGIRYYASKLYPNEPIEQAAKRFTLTDENRLVHRADDGNYYEVEPSSGMDKYAGKIASGAGKAIPVGAGAVAGVVTAPAAVTGVGLAATVGATAGATAGGEYVRQKVGDYLMGDAATPDTNWWEVAGEGAMAGLGQGIGVGAGKLIERNQVRDIDRLAKDYTNKAYGEAGKRGIKLTPGQATGLKTLQAEEKRLATRIPETVDEMADFISKQGDDVENAWYSALDDIAPSKDAAEVGRQVQKAAQSALDDVVKVRKAAASPLYVRAYKESGQINVSSVLDDINKELQTVPKSGAMSNALRAAKGVLTEQGPTTKPSAVEGLSSVKSPGALKGTSIPTKPLTDLQRLHNARVEIGNMIDTRSVPGPDGTPRPINNIIVGKLSRIKNELTRAMDSGSAIDESTGKPLYQLARRTYSELSDDVDDVFASSLKRIADLKDTSMLATAKEAFNPRTRSPEMIRKLGAKLATKDPEAWQALKRLWLQDEITDKLRMAESGDVINSAGKILKGLEDPGMRRSINAALTGAEKQNMEDLKFVLRKISQANLRMGSDTAANLAADKAALERGMPVWAKAQRALGNFWKIPERVADAAAERAMRRNAQQMVKIVTSGDKESLKAIKALRKLSPNQWRALAASGQFMVRGATSAAGRIIAPPPPGLEAPEAQAN